MKKTLVLFVVLFSFLANAQNLKQISVKINSPNDISILIQQGIDLEHSTFSKADNTITLFIYEEEYSRLLLSPLEISVLIDNWEEYYLSLPVPTESEKEMIIADSRMNYNVDGFGFGSLGGFYTYAEIGANLDSMHAQFPDLITQKFSIGTSHNGLNIWAVKISDNPNIQENEPAVGMDALIHAREPQSMATLMYFMWYLLENYGISPEATYLIDNREIYAIPCFNPDGYEYNRTTNPNGGGTWRKNRRNNIGSYGVDLNRNYAYMWGYDNTGSSPTPSSDTYRGPSPASEPETQAVTSFLAGKNIKAHFNMHSGADAFLYPWGYINQACPDLPIYTEYCADMTSYNGYAFGTGYQVLGYNSNGASRDWLYGEQTTKNKIFGYTYEIGVFWPAQSQIIPVAQKNVKPLLYHCWISGEYIRLLNASYSTPYFNPGDYVEMNTVFKNKGLGDGNNISMTLTSLNENAVIGINTISFPVIAARSEVSAAVPFSFSVSPTAAASAEIKLLLTTKSGSSIMSLDTITLYVGTPSFILKDTSNVISQMWTVTATPSNPQWGTTTASFYSAPNSYTDSPSGNYANNATVTMTLTNAVNLSETINPRLSFWTKYAFEAGFDYGQVEISTNNGTSWIPLQGQYTIPGSGTFQPPGQPVYAGTRTLWSREEIDISSYSSAQTKIRFKLRSDAGTANDGWYIDDIGIFFYEIVPVELSSFTADVNEGNVTLSWITATELNNSGFEVERKINSGSQWLKLAFIPGNGTSTELHSYSFADDKPGTGEILYRLKQIDLDGTATFYGPLSVNISGVVDYSLAQNYPNPFNPSTKIKYSVASSGVSGTQVSIKLFDVLGNEVITLVNEMKTAGDYEVEFNAGALASGVYYYTMKSGDFLQSRKMVVIK